MRPYSIRVGSCERTVVISSEVHRWLTVGRFLTPPAPLPAPGWSSSWSDREFEAMLAQRPGRVE